MVSTHDRLLTSFLDHKQHSPLQRFDTDAPMRCSVECCEGRHLSDLFAVCNEVDKDIHVAAVKRRARLQQGTAPGPTMQRAVARKEQQRREQEQAEQQPSPERLSAAAGRARSQRGSAHGRGAAAAAAVSINDLLLDALMGLLWSFVIRSAKQSLD